MTTYAYPYDPTGVVVSNIVANEVHNLVNYTNTFRCVIPLQAPFFRDDILIRHIATGRVLHEGLDYYFGYYYKELSDVVKQAVYGGVIFFDKALTGQVSFERYHTVGGFYLQRKKDLDAWLAVEPMTDPRNVDFSQVMKWPRAVEPIEEPDTLAEAVVKDPVAKAIYDMDQQLRTLNAVQKTKFADVFNRISALSTRIKNDKFLTHQYGSDHHNVTYAQLTALGKDQTAKDTLTAYGYTLSQLIALINKMGITPANASRWYELIGGAFEGRLSLTEGPTIQIKNSDSTSIINIATGQITISATANVEIAADTDKNSPDVSAQLQAGHNTLSVHSSGAGTNKNRAVYNGYYLIHVGNIADYVVASSTSAALELHLSNSAHVTLTGDGSTANPLTGMVSFPSASTTNSGLVQLTDAIQSPSTTLAISGKALYEAKLAIDKYALKTRTVNDKPLSADITLTKADIGLSNVNNTANSEKPVSTAFLSALANKSLDGHTHVLSDLTDVPVASSTVKGITKLQNTIDATTTTAATPVAGRLVDTAIGTSTALLDMKMDCINLPIIEWGSYSDLTTSLGGVLLESIAGWVIKLNVMRYTDLDGWKSVASEIDLSQEALDSYQNAVAYLYLSAGMITVSNQILTDTDYSSYVGYVNTNATTITKIELNPVYRILNNRELLNHISEINAHGHTWNDPGYFNLDRLENKTLTDLVTLPTFADVFNNWYRFSHNTGTVYPANASEITSWSYNAATDSITSTVNSATYIGFVSNEPMGDFVFDAAVSSTNTDDGVIGLVIGFYKDPVSGKEHTLSLLRVLSCDSPTMTTSIHLAYNAYQSDGWSIELAGAKMNYGWSTVGECRIRAVRKGDVYDLTMYGLNVYNGGAVEWTKTLDLNSDPRLAVFKGTTRYGYSTQSQANSTFRSITRPDEDGKSYYASEQSLRTMMSTFESNVGFTQGSVSHGAAVPLPVGFTYAQCKIFVQPKDFGTTNTTSIKYLQCSVDPATGVVTCRISTDGTTWVNGTATYYLFGVI